MNISWMLLNTCLPIIIIANWIVRSTRQPLGSHFDIAQSYDLNLLQNQVSEIPVLESHNFLFCLKNFWNKNKNKLLNLL